MLTDNATAPLILVVEDDDGHVELIQRSFEDAADEYRLQIAGTLRKAKMAILAQTPNLVLTDYRLPDGEGSEILEMAAGSWPVIMMSSQGNELVAVEAMKIGSQDYIVKSPEIFDELPRTVSFALQTWSLVKARRQVDEMVLRAKKDWERTFDAVPDLISLIAADYTITRVNKAMAERCGTTAEELIGKKCYEVVHGLQGAPSCCPTIDLPRDGQVSAKEISEKMLDAVFDVTVSPLTNEDGCITAYVHVMRDITERKRAEQERQKLEQQFLQAQKLDSLGVLTGGIAHDFNNILTIILGHCHMVKENNNSGMTDKDHVLKIETAGNRAADLCRQMLAYAGNSPLLNVQVNLRALVEDLAKMLQATLNKNVVIQLDLASDVPEITGDNAHLQQIVMNLIINAGEAIGDRNGLINVMLSRVTVLEAHGARDFFGNTIQAGDYVCLEVSDNGCGMDEDVKSRIFEPFYTTKFTGRGLGMSAILGIIKSHDGALQLASSTGAGTTFKVYFPLPESPVVVEIIPSAEPVPSTTATGTILLVDDEVAIRTIGSALLNAMGFSAVTASNGREALEIYRERGSEIDLILLDLIMPEMGGVETYHKLRNLRPDVPIVICSGYGVEMVLDNIGADTCVSAIQKPYKPDQLRSTLMGLLKPTI